MAAERRYDETVEESFPASDPPANSGTTGPEDDTKPSDKPASEKPPTD